MTAGRWLDPAWQERGLQALRDTLDVDPRTRKAMVQFLYDEGFWDETALTWAAAIARWNDCLNPSKPSFFKTGELWAIMARFDRHDLFLSMAADLGYEVCRKPTDERQCELVERMTLAMERAERELSDAQQQLSRLRGASAPSTVVASRKIGDTPARFSRDDDAAPGGF